MLRWNHQMSDLRWRQYNRKLEKRQKGTLKPEECVNPSEEGVNLSENPSEKILTVPVVMMYNKLFVYNKKRRSIRRRNGG